MEMDKPEYVNQIDEHFNDETTYVQRTVDTTFSLRTKLNAYLKNVCDRHLVSRVHVHNIYICSLILRQFLYFMRWLKFIN